MASRQRIPELDALRGFALLMMVLHHFIYDIRYLLGLDLFAFQETDFFQNVVRGFFVAVFVVVSGACCQFSRNNLRRALKMGIVSILFSGVMAVVSYVMKEDMYIFFNVLHLLAVGTFLYGLGEWIRHKRARHISNDESPKWPDTDKPPSMRRQILYLSAALFFMAGELVLDYLPHTDSLWLLPLGRIPTGIPGMSDYLPIFPWLGFFFVGVYIGVTRYRHRRTLLPNLPTFILKILSPFVWLGQKSLWIYLLHQPIILCILLSLRGLGIV